MQGKWQNIPVAVLSLFVSSAPGFGNELQGHVDETVADNQHSRFVYYNNAGLHSVNHHDYADAAAKLKKAYAIARRADDQEEMRIALGNLSTLFKLEGNYSDANRMKAWIKQLDDMPILSSLAGKEAGTTDSMQPPLRGCATYYPPYGEYQQPSLNLNYASNPFLMAEINQSNALELMGARNADQQMNNAFSLMARQEQRDQQAEQREWAASDTEAQTGTAAWNAANATIAGTSYMSRYNGNVNQSWQNSPVATPSFIPMPISMPMAPAAQPPQIFSPSVNINLQNQAIAAQQRMGVPQSAGPAAAPFSRTFASGMSVPTGQFMNTSAPLRSGMSFSPAMTAPTMQFMNAPMSSSRSASINLQNSAVASQQKQ